MIPEAQIAHQTPGRLRIQIPSRKGDGAYFSSLQQQLSSVLGIAEVRPNSLTGSLLLLHQTGAEKIAAVAAEKQLFRLVLPEAEVKPFSRRLARDFRELNRKVNRFTGGDLDIPALAFLVLLGSGGYQISQGRFAAPAWYTAFWYALNIFLKGLKEEEAAES